MFLIFSFSARKPIKPGKKCANAVLYHPISESPGEQTTIARWTIFRSAAHSGSFSHAYSPPTVLTPSPLGQRCGCANIAPVFPDHEAMTHRKEYQRTIGFQRSDFGCPWLAFAPLSQLIHQIVHVECPVACSRRSRPPLSTASCGASKGKTMWSWIRA